MEQHELQRLDGRFSTISVVEFRTGHVVWQANMEAQPGFTFGVEVREYVHRLLLGLLPLVIVIAGHCQ